jgi:hypothetical protein
VLYVMGAGRSGSTIFGVTLGNCEGIFYAGELDAWLVRSGVPQVGGEERERFWRAVRERVGERAVALFGSEAQRAVERSMALLRVHRWPARRRLRRDYRQLCEALYLAVADLAGARCVVDTSHYPLRARELQSLPGIDLHLVYLVRDPRSVVGSFNRKDVAQYSKSPFTTNVYLWLTNLLCVPVFLRHPSARRVLVRYEDFLSDPAATLDELLELLGLASPPPDFGSLRTGLAFQGNRVIRSDVVALERPTASRKRAPLTSVLQLPWRAILALLRPRSPRAA